MRNHGGPFTFVRGGIYGLLIFLLASRSARAAIPATERQALIDLYNSTTGAGWGTRTGWKLPPLDADGFAMPGTECTWYGVTCDGAQTTVTSIYLLSNNLIGPLPATIANLVGLVSLSLGGNHLSGAIPSFSANTALGELDLHINQLTGAIPSFASNTALRSLVLSDNQLTGAIPSFAANTALGALSLGSNLLTGAIPSFASNTALWFLSLSNNQFTGTIPSFAANTALEYLYLHNNQLNGTIPSFAANTTLHDLRLNNNQLTGVIPSFAANTELWALFLAGNQLVGSFHASLGTLTSLAPDGLDLRWNALFSADAALITFLNSKQIGGDCQSTQTIPVTGLAISGILPTQVTVNWTPITYSGDTGNYQVFYATVSGGPYAPFATVTPNKSTASLAVTGLAPLTPYFMVVQTTTAPNANNQNTVLSGYSAEIPSATTPVELMRFETE